MKKITGSVLFFILFSCLCTAQLHQRVFKLGDTTGLSNIEDRLKDFELILKGNMDKITLMGNLDSIKQLANLNTAVGDTLLNHIVPIFDGYNTLHPDQGQALKDICDLSEHILQTKSLPKAKKYNQQIIKSYSKLVEAK